MCSLRYNSFNHISHIKIKIYYSIREKKAILYHGKAKNLLTNIFVCYMHVYLLQLCKIWIRLMLFLALSKAENDSVFKESKCFFPFSKWELNTFPDEFDSSYTMVAFLFNPRFLCKPRYPHKTRNLRTLKKETQRRNLLKRWCFVNSCVVT